MFGVGWDDDGDGCGGGLLVTRRILMLMECSLEGGKVHARDNWIHRLELGGDPDPGKVKKVNDGWFIVKHHQSIVSVLLTSKFCHVIKVQLDDIYRRDVTVRRLTVDSTVIVYC